MLVSSLCFTLRGKPTRARRKRWGEITTLQQFIILERSSTRSLALAGLQQGRRRSAASLGTAGEVTGGSHTARETSSWSAGGKSLPRAVWSQRKLCHSGTVSPVVLRERCKGRTTHADCGRGSLAFSFLVKLFLVFARE